MTGQDYMNRFQSKALKYAIQSFKVEFGKKPSKEELSILKAQVFDATYKSIGKDN